jgi:hypothetical protein
LALYSYAITMFVSAFLLFLVQPIIGQKILPKLGGTPSVWNTCVVFFQCALLIGYAYTHYSSKLPIRRQILIHCALLFVPFLILLPNGPFPVEDFRPVTGADPTVATLWLLATIVGIPFFVVSTTAPLLQKWFGVTGHPTAKDPYFLYGASNFGSMLSLLLYPFLFEPIFGLAAQSWFYTIGYVVLVAIVIGCGLIAFQVAPTVLIPGKSGEDAEKTPSIIPEPPAEPMAGAAQSTAPQPSTAVASGPPAPLRPTAATGIKKGGKKHKGRDLAKAGFAEAPSALAASAAPTATPNLMRPGIGDPDNITWPRRLRWIGLAAVPSSLMLGVTVYMSTDISAIPLFWVMPLALYLLSFILVFMRWPIHWLDQAHEYVLYLQPIMLALLALMMGVSGVTGVVGMIFVMLLAFTVTALACHGEMAKDRPSAKHLTEFYLLMSVGGAVGGFFNAILAPKIFPWGIIEFPLALVVAGLLRPSMRDMGWTEQLFEGRSASAAAKHGKSAKKVVKTSEPASGISLVLDIVLPLATTLGLYLLIQLCTSGATQANYTERLFYALIGPVIITACYFARPLRFGLALGGVLLVTGMQDHATSTILFTTRSYFGLLRVRTGTEYYGKDPIPYVNLMHGTTHHGMLLQPVPGVGDFSRIATTYYHRQGPVGICMERFNWFPPKDSDNNNYFASDARMPASLVGLGAPALGVSLPISQLVASWSEPAYAVIGLGTGTMASYARPYQTVHFYEIDEQIRLLSLPEPGGRTYFTYLENALQKRKANVQVLMGDARLRMALPWVAPKMEGKELGDIPFESRGGPNYFYHLMVVDAFSSDAIPRHLITKEAMEMYFKHLVQGHWIDLKDVPSDQRDPKFDIVDPTNPNRVWVPGGVLCVHTSNRHLRLVPVVADTAKMVTWEDLYDRDENGTPKTKTGLVAIRGHDNAPGHQFLKKPDDIGHFTSEWVIVARDKNDVKHLKTPPKYGEWIRLVVQEHPQQAGLAQDEYWRTQEPTGKYVWTDDHTNLMAVFRWPWEHGRE